MWQAMWDVFDLQFAGITLLNAGLALLAILGGLGGAWLLRNVLLRLKSVTEKGKTRYADTLVDALIKPATWAVLVAGLWLGVTALAIPPEHEEWHQFLQTFFKGGSILLIVWFAIRLSDRTCAAWAKNSPNRESQTDHRMVQFVRGLARVLLVVVGATLFMQNLGYSVGSLLAGLGLGGAALALASKDLLSNVFGSVAIFWDRSFAVGDWVEIGQVEGNVEEVGLRNTKIRTFSNSLVTMPNSSLMTGSINNWTRMKKRRAQVRLHLDPTTPPAKLLELVHALRKRLSEDDSMVADDYIVTLDTIERYSICLFVQFFTKSVVWKEHLESKQGFLIKAMESMLGLGVTLASFPVLVEIRRKTNGEQNAAS